MNDVRRAVTAVRKAGLDIGAVKLSQNGDITVLPTVKTKDAAVDQSDTPESILDQL